MIPSLQMQTARIQYIDIEADRYGRLRPCLWLSTTFQPLGAHRPEHPKLYLDSIAALYKHAYSLGDLVQVRYFGTVPKIISTVESMGEPHQPLFIGAGLCSHCQLPLKCDQGQYYCTAEHCPLKLYAQLRYAIRPDVLDLPFDKDILDEIIWGRELLDDVSSLCFLDHQTLAGLPLHPDEVDVIVDVLRNRQAMLAGHYRTPGPHAPPPHVVQRLTRGRFLDALSLPGLYRPTIHKLLDHLDQQHWRWEELPHLLLDRTGLLQYGVDRTDARLIIRHAAPRGLEFDRLIRSF